MTPAEVIAMRDRLEKAEATLERIEAFMSTVHGLNEMNVIRGLRKVIAGEHSTFQHEVRLSVYGEPCGHTPREHYPEGYGKCNECKGSEVFDEEDDGSRWY